MRLVARGVVSLACCALVAVAAAGCGSSSSDDKASTSGSSDSTVDVAQATKLMTASEQPVKWQAPGPAFELPASVQGKKVYIVAAQLNFDFTQQVVAGAEAGAKVAGMTVDAVDAQGSPANAIRLVSQGLSQGADAIVIISFPSSVVASALQQAKAKGVPAVVVGEQDSGLPTAEQKALGVFGEAGPCNACAGREMANAAVAQSDGKSFKTTYVQVPSSNASQVQGKAFKDQVEQLCADCEVDIKDVDFAQWATQLKPTASAAVTSGSTVLAPAYDAMVPLMEAAVFQNNAAGRVKFNSFNATAPVMKELATTDNIQADVGTSNVWVGWALMDQVLRGLSGEQPAESSNIPNRTFTKSNIGELDLKGNEDEWYADPVTFPQEFTKLWGQ